MLNKVQLIGGLGKDPEMSYTNDSQSICTLSIATSEHWRDKITGEKKEKTEWHRVIFFGVVAGICEKWLKKGSKVYIEGSIQTRKWTDKNGQDRYSTEIKGREMKMLGSKSDNNTQRDGNNQGCNSNKGGQNNPTLGATDNSLMDDDFPF